MAANDDLRMIPRAELEQAAAELLGGSVDHLSRDDLFRLITITQYATDLMLNEVERRGELTEREGMVIVPYLSEHVVKTVLTR